MTIQQIANDVVVSLAYKMLVDGEVVEEAGHEDPLDYLHGHENIVPGLERALEGKRVGDRLSVTLQPADAYGEYDDEAVELVDAEDLPDEITAGTELILEDEEGYMLDVVVKEVTGEGVLIDMNPPFAGKTVTYEVEVIGLREADKDELDHGHPHSDGFEDEYDYDEYDEEEEYE